MSDERKVTGVLVDLSVVACAALALAGGLLVTASVDSASSSGPAVTLQATSPSVAAVAPSSRSPVVLVPAPRPARPVVVVRRSRAS